MNVNFREDDRLVRILAYFEDEFGSLVQQFEFDGLSLDAAIDQVANRFEELIDSARGPTFDDDGYVSPTQSCTEKELIRWFGTNPHRRDLIERVQIWIRLATAVGAKRLLVDGSFVTAKDHPGDVDAVVLLPEDFREQVIERRHKAVELLLSHFCREPKELFFAETEEDWWQWFEFFSRTREQSGRRKGLFDVHLR